MAFFGSKVHFLGQILDYNIQNLNKTAYKKLFDLLEQRCSICVDNAIRKTLLYLGGPGFGGCLVTGGGGFRRGPPPGEEGAPLTEDPDE